MKNILFVNHREKACGVGQMGRRYFAALQQSRKFNAYYIDIDGEFEFDYWVKQLEPAAVLYNFYSGATMGWLSNELIESNRPYFKQLSIYHELPLDSKGFDLILHQDPTAEDSPNYWKLPRCIPIYSPPPFVEPEVPVFTSFGFGIGGKGFSDIVRKVQEEYDRAVIRLSIPFAHFGDADGRSAHAHAEDAAAALTKPGIELEISHDFLEEKDLLDLLAQSTCNCFFYPENYGRGISGTLDYALAVKRPIAITPSYQFKHVWPEDENVLITQHSLHEIVEMGTEHLEVFYQKWSTENLVASYEAAFESLGV